VNLTGMTCSKCAAPLRAPALIYDGIEAGRFDLRVCKKCWDAILDAYNRDVAGLVPVEK
jgi:hypothetical protein